MNKLEIYALIVCGLTLIYCLGAASVSFVMLTDFMYSLFSERGRPGRRFLELISALGIAGITFYVHRFHWKIASDIREGRLEEK